MAQLLKVDGTVEEVEPENPKKGFTLKELYAMLNCDLVEVAYPIRGMGDWPNLKGKIMIVDEEGWYRQPTLNGNASAMLGYTEIAGPALVCKKGEFK